MRTIGCFDRLRCCVPSVPPPIFFSSSSLDDFSTSPPFPKINLFQLNEIRFIFFSTRLLRPIRSPPSEAVHCHCRNQLLHLPPTDHPPHPIKYSLEFIKFYSTYASRGVEEPNGCDLFFSNRKKYNNARTHRLFDFLTIRRRKKVS